MRLLAILAGAHLNRAQRAPSPSWPRDPARDLAATLPDLDGDGWAGPRVRDPEREERDEALSWEAERARQLAALGPRGLWWEGHLQVSDLQSFEASGRAQFASR